MKLPRIDEIYWNLVLNVAVALLLAIILTKNIALIGIYVGEKYDSWKFENFNFSTKNSFFFKSTLILLIAETEFFASIKCLTVATSKYLWLPGITMRTHSLLTHLSSRWQSEVVRILKLMKLSLSNRIQTFQFGRHLKKGAQKNFSMFYR